MKQPIHHGAITVARVIRGAVEWRCSCGQTGTIPAQGTHARIEHHVAGRMHHDLNGDPYCPGCRAAPENCLCCWCCGESRDPCACRDGTCSWCALDGADWDGGPSGTRTPTRAATRRESEMGADL